MAGSALRRISTLVIAGDHIDAFNGPVLQIRGAARQFRALAQKTVYWCVRQS